MEGGGPGPPVPFLRRQSVGDAADDILVQKVNELFVRAAIKGLHKKHTCGILWIEKREKNKFNKNVACKKNIDVIGDKTDLVEAIGNALPFPYKKSPAIAIAISVEQRNAIFNLWNNKTTFVHPATAIMKPIYYVIDCGA